MKNKTSGTKNESQERKQRLGEGGVWQCSVLQNHLKRAQSNNKQKLEKREKGKTVWTPPKKQDESP